MISYRFSMDFADSPLRRNGGFDDLKLKFYPSMGRFPIGFQWISLILLREDTEDSMI